MISKTREMKKSSQERSTGCHLDKKKKKMLSRACFEFRVLVVRRKKKFVVSFRSKNSCSEFNTLLSPFNRGKGFVSFKKSYYCWCYYTHVAQH